MNQFTVKKDEVTRLDTFLANKLPLISRSFIQKLARDQEILVNKLPVKAGHKVKAKDKVEILFDLSKINKTDPIELDVIYEDDDCIVINKPVGVLSHSKSLYSSEPSVSSFIAKRSDGVDGERAGIVHRLDRATSGVMIGAKNSESLAWLQKQFSSRQAKKTYIAIVSGTPVNEEAIIEMPIERNPKMPATYRVNANGKAATTQYKVIHSNSTHSLISLTPKTGRTHQLRVHLKHIGHPIVGDPLYGGDKADRLYLHALSLEIDTLNKVSNKFETNLPNEFNNYMKHDKK